MPGDDDTKGDDGEDQEVDGSQSDEQSDDEDDFDKERALSTIRRQRESEKALKKTLNEVQSELKKLQAKDESESETAKRERQEVQERADKLERKFTKAVLKSTAIEAATRLGFRNPTLAARLVDPDEVEWEDDEPQNVERLLKKELRADPSLKGRRSDDDDEDDDDADAGSGRKSRQRGNSSSMNDQIRAAAGRG